MFAAITPALITGALAERVRFRTYLIFVFLWTTLVYDFIAHWMWSPMGWLHQLGVLDLAGGAAVHTASGMSGLVFALLLKSRNGYYTIWITLKKKIMQKLHGKKDNETVEPPTEKFVRAPNNVPYVVLGTALLWFGWMVCFIFFKLTWIGL
jgi:Amt family ammonium transporter